MIELAKQFVREEGGATSIEYALIASFIGMAVVVVVGNIGTSLNTVFTNVKTGFD
jgi:pilus assembly protein Flp/PilA